MFSTKRLKKKSQSVDIGSQGFSPTLVPASPLNRTAPPVAKTLAVQENNTTNSQKRNPRVGELKRGYTIDTGQKKTPEKKDGRRMSFQRPKGTVEYSVESRDTLNSIALKFDTTPNELVQLNKLFSRAVVPGQVLYVPDPEYVSSVGSSPSLSPISPLSPTSSEADLDKVTGSPGIFNYKYNWLLAMPITTRVQMRIRGRGMLWLWQTVRPLTLQDHQCLGCWCCVGQ
ncbi:oxidation resistance protein 1a isoform X2 [Boleophthalmus pectinirostris]|uniref:oxidation resistance protein 1a isoform X2 n=1 Tax=Boleophthalmus pectinirostris TaxID=150288 RepID=UPI00242FE8FF|nr:oxidation resistance protein 1a isoform X2 [Boleophthalmus pectinirostris]